MLEYSLHILVLICIYSILAMSLSFSLGYTGLPCFAQPALFAIGAYAAAFAGAWGSPFLANLLIAAAVGAAFAYVMSFPALQMSGDYFAIVTLGFSEITRLVLLNESARYSAAGDVGIVGVPKASMFGFDFDTPGSFAILSIAALALSAFFLHRLTRSPYGRVLRAIHQDEPVTDVIGKDTRKFKVQVLVIVGFFSGVAGCLWAYYIQFVHPTQFTPDLLVFILASVVLINEASIPAAILGSAFMVTFPELMRFFGLPQSFVGASRLMIMGVAVVGIILLRERRRASLGKGRA